MHPLLHITDSLVLPSYLLLISSVFLFGVIWVIWSCKKKGFDLKDGIDLSLAIMIGGFLGARTLHVIFEAPDYYLEDPIRVFQIWYGGFVFYGGAIGAFVSAILVIKVKRLNYGLWADFFAPAFPIGYAVGRLACLLNGCCFGKQCDLPWAIEIPRQVGLRHPTQAYSAILETLLFLCILIVLKKRKSLNGLFVTLQPPGQLFHLWIFGHGFNRLIMEAFRDDYRGPQWLTLSISSWISLVLISASSYAIWSTYHHFECIRKRKP